MPYYRLLNKRAKKFPSYDKGLFTLQKIKYEQAPTVWIPEALKPGLSALRYAKRIAGGRMRVGRYIVKRPFTRDVMEVEWLYDSFLRGENRTRWHLLWRDEVLKRRLQRRRVQDFRSVRTRTHTAHKFLFNLSRYKNRGINRNFHRSVHLRFGHFGVKVLRSCKLQIHNFRALHLLMLRFCKKVTKFKFVVSFRWPLTAKTRQRMGTGKGKLQYRVANISRGEVVLEFGRLPSLYARQKLFRLLYSEFPVPIKIIYRFNNNNNNA